jgi:hypothetical protein
MQEKAMRPDQQKLRATQKSGIKDEAKDLENNRQLKAASKRGHETEKSGQGHVRRQDESRDEKGSPRSNG